MVVFWIVAICCTCFQKSGCQKDTPGKCITAGFWGLSPCGFLLLLAGLGDENFRLVSSLVTAQLRRRLKWLLYPGHLFPCLPPGFLLGHPRMGAPLGNCAMFVLVHQLHEMEQSGPRERWKRHGCLPQVSSVHLSFPEAPVPGTGFPLLPPENSTFLIHIGGWTKEAGAALELTF